VLGFYRVYHSMRYVEGDLVLRLKKRLSEPTLAEIRRDFADILVTGTIEQGEALSAEANDVAAIGLPRLVFRFDRKNLGRLRQMVDRINRDG